MVPERIQAVPFHFGLLQLHFLCLTHWSVSFVGACFSARSVAGLTLLFAVSFRIVEPTLIASVGGLIPGIGIRHCVSILSQVDWFRSEVRAGSFRPSPTTYPENGTNSSADLVEAVSLAICEEITWRPIFFGCWFRSIVDRVQSFLPVIIRQVLTSCSGNFYQ